MSKIIKVSNCLECPYLRYPWTSTIDATRYACGNSFEGTERPRGEKHWLGGDASPGDRLIDDIHTIPVWCKLKEKK